MGEVEKGCGCVQGIGSLSREKQSEPGAATSDSFIPPFSPRHFIRLHCPLCAVKRLLRKLLDVGLACCVVHDCVVVGALRLCGLEALKQRLCEVEAVIVGGVEALAYNLVDGMVFACFCVSEEMNRGIWMEN